MSYLSFVFAFLVLAPSAARGQVHLQPTEIVIAPPLTPFSERSGLWHATTTPIEMTYPETAPVTEYLNTIPGVQARQDGSPTVSVRGSALADRVLTLYDDIPLNFADGFGASSQLLPREALAELRLFKGPASVFFGSSAMGGAINYSPRYFERPAIRLNADESSGRLQNRAVFGALPIQWGPDRRQKLQVTALNEYDPGDYKFESISTEIRGRRQDNESRLQRYTVTGDQAFGSWKIRERIVAARETGAAPGEIVSPSRLNYSYSSAMGSLGASREVSPSAKIGLRAASLYQENVFDEHTSVETRSYSTKNLLAADVTQSLSPSVIMRTFGDFSHDEFRETYSSYKGSYLQHSTQIGQSYEIAVGPQWSLQPAYRYLSEYGRVVGAFGAFREAGRHKNWLTYSQGFRPPSLSDRYSRATYFTGDPSLKPERSEQYEAGYQLKPLAAAGILTGLSFETAVFLINYRDLLESIPIGAGAVTKANTGRARAAGAELATGYSYKVWTASAAYGFLESTNETSGEPLRLSPRHQWAFTVTQALGPFVIELRETVWSPFYDRGFGTGWRRMPGWETLDFNVRSLGFTNWEFKGGVLNVFDEARELTLHYPEPQRRFYLSALRYF